MKEKSGKKPSLFAYAGFRNLWVGQLISQFGDTLHMWVFLWMVLEVTKDPAAVGVVGAFEALPYILFSIPAGVMADRYDRRRILILSDVFSAALVGGFMGTLFLIPQPTLPIICAFGFALGTVNVVAAPARNAAIPRLVPEERLIDANTLNSTIQNVMPLLGNALSAVALKALFTFSQSLSYVLTFGFNAVTFLISAVFMGRLPTLVPERKEKPGSPMQETLDGLRFIRRHPVLGPAMLGSFLLNFFVSPFMPTYVVVAQQKYKGSPALLAFLETGFFLGMALGSLILFRLPVKRAGMAFSVYLSLAALMILPMGYMASPWLFWILNFFCGVFIPPATVPLNTLIQLETPDELRGRVNAALGMVSALVTPIGTACSGFLLRWLGIEGIFLFMGGGLLISPLLPLFSKAYRTAEIKRVESESTAG